MRQLERFAFGDERGVTLTELVVTLALFGMIMVGVIGTWSRAQEAYFVGSAATEVQQNTRAAIDFMVREIRSAGRDATICAFDYEDAGSSGDCLAAKVTRCQTLLTGNYSDNNNATCPSGVTGRPANGCGCVFAMPYDQATVNSIRIRSDRNGNGRIFGMGNAIVTGPPPGPDDDRGEEDVRYSLATTVPPCPDGVPACIVRTEGTASPQVAMVAVDITGFKLTYFPRPGFGTCTGNPPPIPCPPFALPFTSQVQADNVARIRMEITAQQATAGSGVQRTLVSDIVLKNRR
jgi:prepilin-type N-terminal cleavage/methylation domain-containing protein